MSESRDVIHIDDMTLRDYFAAKAMAAIIIAFKDGAIDPGIYVLAYKHADALLAERDK